MQTALFYIPILSFFGGVFLRSFLYISIEVSLLGLVISFGLALLFWRRSRLPTKGVTQSSLHILLIFILVSAGFSLGIFRFSIAEDKYTNSPLASIQNNPVTLTGTVIREPDSRANTKLITIETSDGGRFLFSTDRFFKVAYGDEVKCHGELKIPESFTTELGRSFDYQGYLLARGVTHTMSFGDIEVVSPGNPHHPLRLLYEAKSYFLNQLSKVINYPALGLGEGLLLGIKSSLGEDLEESFRKSGIIHIVVLSGYNIMLIITFVMYVLAFLLPYRTRLIAGIVAVAVFALLVGYSPSVARASVMAIIFLLSSLLARPYFILRALVLAIFVMLLINPYSLVFDVGFQLSVFATLGLIAIAPSFENLLLKSNVKEGIRAFIVATLSTQIAVLPLILYQIGEWSLIALPVNLLVLPMVAVAMLLTFTTGIVAMVSVTLALPIAFLAEVSLMYIITIAEFGGNLAFATLTVPPFPGYVVILMYILMGGAWYWWWRKSETKNLPKLERVKDKLDVSDWEIVEEASLETKTKAGVAEATPANKEETPIFFR